MAYRLWGFYDGYDCIRVDHLAIDQKGHVRKYDGLALKVVQMH